MGRDRGRGDVCSAFTYSIVVATLMMLMEVKGGRCYCIVVFIDDVVLVLLRRS